MAYFWQTRMAQEVRNGAWLTPSRIRGYSLILLGFYVIAVAVWIVLSHGLIDPNDKPLGTDFSSFYAAGSLALEGHAAETYNMAEHYARQQQLFGASVPYYAWFYPPFFLFIVAPLALMPYSVALVVWQTGTMAFYLGMIGAILRPARRINPGIEQIWIWPALAFPAVFINFGHGQNGFLTAGLFGAALLTLTKRPIVSGILFGCLASKPQFALVIPVALLAAGQWRAIAAAAGTVIALVAVTSLAFGWDIWLAFAASMEMSRKLLLEQGNIGFEKLQSAFAVTRMWGGGTSLAYIIQGIVSAAVVCGVAWVWRYSCDRNAKAAILPIAALLASPHTLDYDLMLLAPAIAFIATSGLTDGFRHYEISTLAAAWFVPLISRSIAGVTEIPLGLLALIALFVVILRRAMTDRDELVFRNSKLAQA